VKTDVQATCCAPAVQQLCCAWPAAPLAKSPQALPLVAGSSTAAEDRWVRLTCLPARPAHWSVLLAIHVSEPSDEPHLQPGTCSSQMAAASACRYHPGLADRAL